MQKTISKCKLTGASLSGHLLSPGNQKSWYFMG